jgi:hypothetical protein
MTLICEERGKNADMRRLEEALSRSLFYSSLFIFNSNRLVISDYFSYLKINFRKPEEVDT